jgi:hypothetical protein
MATNMPRLAEPRDANPFTAGEISTNAGSSGGLVSVESQRAVAEVHARMMIARANPRDSVRCMDRILNDCTRPTLAKSAIYQYARGGTDIRGPSIRLAESGQADVIAHEPHGLRDLKTGQRPPAALPQIGAYALLARSNGLDVETAAIDFVRRVPVTKPQPDPVTFRADIGYAEVAAVSILKHIASELRTFREGDPERRILPGDPWAFPANPSSNLCGEKWCSCWGVTGPHAFCHEWRK